MSDNTVAVEKIKKYLLDNKLKQVDLAVTYNKEPQDVANILAGRKKDPASNRFVLKVISDLKIRYKEQYERNF
ncbi:TPA: hypothetical protein ACGQ3D_001370 [Streptococcus agalactiae]